MVTEDQIEKAFDWLAKNEVAAAEARAQRTWADEYRKSLKAILMAESNAKTVSEREAYAYSHERYLEHLNAIRAAVLADETFRARVGRLHMLVDYWRSQESSRRAMGAVS
jgi:hypothetical protein